VICRRLLPTWNAPDEAHAAARTRIPKRTPQALAVGSITRLADATQGAAAERMAATSKRAAKFSAARENTSETKLAADFKKNLEATIRLERMIFPNAGPAVAEENVPDART